MNRLILALALLLVIAPGVRAQPFATLHPELISPPDICAPATFNFPVERVARSTSDEPTAQVDLEIHFRPDNLPTGPFQKTVRPVILILTGNGYIPNFYRDMATFLARQGFIVGVHDRQNQTDIPRVFVALERTLGEFELQASSPVGLIGHSRGAAVAVEAAASPLAAGFDIRAVAALAPTIGTDATPLNGNHVRAYALLYGSQDEDVDAVASTSSTPVEAFAAYDRAGTEDSTTCVSPPCGVLTGPPFERFLIYVHGLSHPGIVGLESCPGGPSADCLPDSDYLDLADEECLGRGYANALMQWILRGDSRYRRVLTGAHLPGSIAAMRTDAPDHNGLPANRRLTILHQWSPANRLVVNNFENWSVGQLFGATSPIIDNFAVLEPGALSSAPTFFRNDTHVLAFTWEEVPRYQWIGFRTPPNARDITSFSHIALRIGPLRGLGSGAVEPPATETQPLMICLHSLSRTVCRTVSDAIVPVDLRPAYGASQTQHGISAMRTITVGLSSFRRIRGFDRTQVEAVILALPASTYGTVAVDSIEWFRE